MRILFLDYDGVLHPLGLRVQAGRFINGKPVAKPIQVDFFCWLDLLAQLLKDHPDVKLVAHTSWRDSHTPEQLGAYLGPLQARYLGCTQPGLQKYASILGWLQQHADVTEWRALDDAHAEFTAEEPIEQFIATDYQTGIADADVQAQLRQWLQATRPT